MVQSTGLILPLISLAAVVEAKVLWSSSPATIGRIIQEAYPVGNGVLGAMPFGAAGAEKVNLNVDSLWSGGPFENSSYAGGNPKTEVASALGGIRDWIFQKGTGNLTQLLGPNDNFGSYRVLGNFSIEIDSISNASKYRRALDLSTGVHTTSFTSNAQKYESKVYCSFPDQVCTYELSSSGRLPKLLLKLENQLVDPILQKQACNKNLVRLTGVTQIGPPEGMKYVAVARVIDGVIKTECARDVLIVTPGRDTKLVTVVISAGTNFDQTKGNAQSGYSFKGVDPGPKVEQQAAAAARKSPKDLVKRHIDDYKSLTGRFSLDLPDKLKSADVETSDLILRYKAAGTGDPFLEGLLFDYARHMFISASRENSLPPNLQGRWSEGLYAAWSGDYHANINIQMNHWVADVTGLGDLQVGLWRYIEQNWAPRGAETAKLLYGAPGFAVHNEMNIFGHTAMKSDASWANYPVAAAWMMQHVWDNFEYSQDVSWLRKQGYGLIKQVAQFWLSQLVYDDFSDDGTLVVNPCNSAEHGPTTFGCTHYQQLIHQVFEAVLRSAAVIDEPDKAFLNNVTATLKVLDKGVHIGSWGQIKEWKLPESFGLEIQNDTHRHLSDLVGWYPGYSISSFHDGFNNKTIQDAVATKLWSRGIGTGPDANAGWAKVWRSACWARLKNTERAYFELRYAIEQNFAPNGFSMYSGRFTPFQIDANYGLGGAILSMLIVDLPQPYGSKDKKTVMLGPAIPESWAGGSVKGLRIRGGGSVDFSWDDQGVVTNAKIKDRNTPVKVLNKQGKTLIER